MKTDIEVLVEALEQIENVGNTETIADLVEIANVALDNTVRKEMLGL